MTNLKNPVDLRTLNFVGESGVTIKAEQVGHLFVHPAIGERSGYAVSAPSGSRLVPCRNITLARKAAAGFQSAFPNANWEETTPEAVFGSAEEARRAYDYRQELQQ